MGGWYSLDDGSDWINRLSEKHTQKHFICSLQTQTKFSGTITYLQDTNKKMNPTSAVLELVSPA